MADSKAAAAASGSPDGSNTSSPSSANNSALDDMKRLVIDALERKGVLNKLRAELRASVFSVIDENKHAGARDDSDAGVPAALGDVLSSDKGMLAFGLVLDFLGCCDMQRTLAVLAPESNQDLSLNRTRLGAQLVHSGAAAAAVTDVQTPTPLLVALLRGGFAGSGSGAASAASTAAPKAAATAPAAPAPATSAPTAATSTDGSGAAAPLSDTVERREVKRVAQEPEPSDSASGGDDADSFLEEIPESPGTSHSASMSDDDDAHLRRLEEIERRLASLSAKRNSPKGSGSATHTSEWATGSTATNDRSLSDISIDDFDHVEAAVGDDSGDDF